MCPVAAKRKDGEAMHHRDDAQSVDGDDPLINEQEVARLLGWSRRTLQRRRWEGEPPAFVKIGSSVRYRRSTILNFIRAGERSATADPGAAA
jgi:predicted DNA-binding transcriptional regulator AlpA